MGREPALLAEEHGQRADLGQQGHLIADDAAQRVVGGAVLGDDPSQPLLELVDGPLDDQAQQLFLAGDVAVERDLGESGALGDGVQGGGPVAELTEGGRRGANDPVQDRRLRWLHPASYPVDSTSRALLTYTGQFKTETPG
jgi:hypothetical protein